MRDLARRAGMSQPFLSNIENARATPSIATLYRLGGALGVSPQDFLPARPDEGLTLVRRGDGLTSPVGEQPEPAPPPTTRSDGDHLGSVGSDDDGSAA